MKKTTKGTLIDFSEYHVKLHPCTNTIYASTATALDTSLSADRLYCSSHSQNTKEASISVYTTCSWRIGG